MKTLFTACALLSLVLSTGCANLRIGTNFNPAMANEIQPNITTRADVRGLLGRPLRSHTIGEVTLDVHKYVSPRRFSCVYVSYRGDKVMHVTQVR